MKISGQQTFSAGSEIIWSLLHDPLILPKIIPGCRFVIPAGPDEYRLAAELRIGQHLEPLEGSLRFEKIVPYRNYSFIAEGSNPDGTVSCRGDIVLEDSGPALALLTYVIDVETNGRPAAITDRMMQTTTRSFIRRSFEALEHQVAVRTRVYTTTVVPGRESDHQPYLPMTPDRSDIRHRLLIVMMATLVILLVGQRVGRGRGESAND